jgi:hypothetical protein
MKFYCLTDKKWTADIKEVKYRIIKTPSGKRKQAYAVCKNGHKVTKFVKM